MLTNEQFIEQIRAELQAGMEVLKPSQELLEAVEELTPENGRSPHGAVERPTGRDQRRWRGRVRGLGAAVPALAAVIVVLVVGAVALTALRPHHSSTLAGAGIAAKTGQVAFVSGWSLEFANPDGSGLREVGSVPHQCDGTALGRGAGCFAWSPDGKQFAYLAGGSHKLTLYLVGADGQHPRPLTACGDCQGVSWSPDGSQIAVGRYVAGGLNVWVVDATSGAMRRITSCPPHSLGKVGPYSATCGDAGDVYASELQWSPDGRRIFFIRWGVPTGGVFPVPSLGTVRPDGSDQTELKIPGAETAQWSPDGRELAVVAFNGVYIVDAAGTVRELAKAPPGLQGIAWSPNGRELAIATAGGIYTIDADGKALTRLAAPAAPDGDHQLFLSAAAWSPNGKELAYGSSTGPRCPCIHARHVEGVWTINADGSDGRLIYKTIPLLNGSVVNAPLWSPDGSQFAFSSYDGIYVANADGSHLHRIDRGPWPAFAWQPNPSTR